MSQTVSIGKLTAEMGADVASLRTDMQKATQVVDQASKQMQTAAQQIANAFADKLGVLDMAGKAIGALANPAVALGVAAAAAVTGIIAITEKAIVAGDEMDKLAQRTGVSVETLSSWKHEAEIAGLSIDDLAVGIKKLSTQMVAAAENGGGPAATQFQSLGISVTDAAGRLKDADTVMIEVAGKFSTMRDGAEKSALAVQLFGKQGTQMIPFLNQGSEALRKMSEDAKKLGLTISSEFAAQASEFNDNLERLTKVSGALGREIAATLLPSLNYITDAMLEAKMSSGLMETALTGVGATLAAVFSDGPQRLAQARAELDASKKMLEARREALGIVDPNAAATESGAALIKQLQQQVATLGLSSAAAQKYKVATEQMSVAQRKMATDLLDQTRAFAANEEMKNLAIEQWKGYLSAQDVAVIEAKKKYTQMLKDAGDNATATKAIRQRMAEDIGAIARKEALDENAAAQSVVRTKIDGVSAAKSALETSLADSLKLEQGYAQKIADLQNSIAAVHQDASDKIRALQRGDMSSANAQLDLQDEIKQKSEQAAQAILSGDTKQAEAIAKNIEALGNELDSTQAKIEVIKQAEQIQVDARNAEIAATQAAADVQRQKSEDLQKQIAEDKSALESFANELSALEDQKHTIEVTLDTTLANQKLDELRQKLGNLQIPDGGMNIGASVTGGASGSSSASDWTWAIDNPNFAGGPMPGFATGGNFVVGGSGGTDSTLVRFMATPGERVSVQTPGQQQPAAAPVFNITLQGVQDPAELARRLQQYVRANPRALSASGLTTRAG